MRARRFSATRSSIIRTKSSRSTSVGTAGRSSSRGPNAVTISVTMCLTRFDRWW